jgi:hypothetical protein
MGEQQFHIWRTLLIFTQLKNNEKLLYTMQEEEFTINRILPLMLSVSDIQLYDVNNLIYSYDKVVSNKVGTISKCITDVTWIITLKEVLGDLYDKYDYFNLEVAQIMSTQQTGRGHASHRPFLSYVNLEYQNLNVFISGLNWLRSSFNQKTGNENNTVHLCNIRDIFNGADNYPPSWFIFNSASYNIYIGQTGYMNYNLCFKKEPTNVKINIRLGGLGTGLDYTPAIIFDNKNATARR